MKHNGKAYVLKKFIYVGSQVKRLDLNRTGTEAIEVIDEYNSKGELIRTTRPAYRQFAESLYEYRYDKTDEKGNWPERTVTGKSGQWGNKQKDVRLEKREITYYWDLSRPTRPAWHASSQLGMASRAAA